MSPRAKPEAAAVKASDLVQELVHQFSETLSFYRELIQNSIDAGANRIDVSLEHDPATGRVVIRVEDDGEGMNERIIDEYLTVLFRSTKDDDLTKIGKFGIGFVSVFAPQPKLVRVYTARDGESWRVDFHSVDRFEKYRMPRLRDGTLVELHKDLPAADYAKLVADSRAAVRYWCRHSETRITFRDGKEGTLEEINEPFELEGGAALRYEEEGTQIVLGPAWTDPPPYGFYNRGLTLKEGDEAFFPGVRFKVKSRWLEHTLTRDNVTRDENYDKAMRVVARLVDEELPEKVLAEAERLAAGLSAAAGAGREAECAKGAVAWGRLLPYLVALFDRRWTFLKGWDKRLILPGVGGKPLSVKEARDTLGSANALLVDERRTAVSDALNEEGRPVVYGGAWAHPLAQGLIGAAGVATASQAFFLPRLLGAAELEPNLAALLAAAASVDSRTGFRYSSLSAADFEYAGSCIADRIFVVQNEAGQLAPVGERPVSSFFFGSKRRAAVVNANHPFVRRLAALQSGRSGLASFLLLKTLHLHDGEAPPEERDKFCSLAEKTELKLLEASLKLDTAWRRA